MQSCRALLDWNQDILCEKVGVAKSTIGDFERGVRNLRIETMQKLVGIFEENGIRFESEGNRILVELRNAP